MITFIASIFVFSLVVLVHEYGHYKAAKSVGIQVDEFAIGMGPLVYKKEKNGTLYTIRLLPIGGFVKMVGEEEDVDSPNSYNNKTVWQRAKVIFSGPLMNFILALVIYIIMSVVYGTPGTTIGFLDEVSPLYDAGIREGDKITEVNGNNVYIRDDLVTEVTQVEAPYSVTIERENGEIETIENIPQYYRYIIGIYPFDTEDTSTSKIKPSDNTNPAYKSGIREGDIITEINGVSISTYDEVTENILSSEGNDIDITVDRDGELIDFVVTPQKSLTLGFDTTVEKSVVTAVVSSVYKTGYYISVMFDFIGSIFTGGVTTDDVGGPVMVISMIGQQASLGLYPLLNLLAFISVNLGFMNLLPIPALDGSKLMFLALEKIRGKKISAEKEGMVHLVGFAVLMAFMLFITYNDIMRFFR